MSVAGSRKSTIGPGHDGGPKDGFLAEPGEPGLSVHHDPNDARVGDDMSNHPSIARRAGAKRLTPVPTHNAMITKSRRTGEHFVGVGGDGISAYDANPGTNPLGGAPRGKDLKPVAISPGMKSQSIKGPLTNDEHFALGKKVLNQAGDASSANDRAALGIGTLPATVKEN
jgi:hypothetical protein